jgi:hypothetical protein
VVFTRIYYITNGHTKKTLKALLLFISIKREMLLLLGMRRKKCCLTIPARRERRFHKKQATSHVNKNEMFKLGGNCRENGNISLLTIAPQPLEACHGEK